MSDLPKIQGVDVEKVLENLGISETAYFDMLGSFRRDIRAKISAIRSNSVLWDLSDFVILVHGVKGSSRTVGFSELGEKMYALELAGKAGDRDFIKENLDKTLEYYESYEELLLPFDSRAGVTDKKKSDEGEISGLLEKLKIALEDFESDESEELMKEIALIALPDNLVSLYGELTEAMDNFDYFTSLECVKKMMEVSDNDR